MKIVIPGGSGHLGTLLVDDLAAGGHELVVLSRSGDAGPGAGPARHVAWDGNTAGPWESELDGADALVNLAGRSVDCRYTKTNLREMLDSRVRSTRALGAACARARRPPRVWLQASTATIYSHRFDAPNAEADGHIGGDEPDAPLYWRWSIDIARAWEQALHDAPTPGTRKIALRMAMVMSLQRGAAFDMLRRLARLGLGGSIAGGLQYMSWIHERDFLAAISFLLDHGQLSGSVNVCAPEPLPQRDFARILREACGMPLGLPLAGWMLQLGAVPLRTDSELLLKSRRVIPGRLLEAGFAFEYPSWQLAARELVARRRGAHALRELAPGRVTPLGARRSGVEGGAG